MTERNQNSQPNRLTTPEDTSIERRLVSPRNLVKAALPEEGVQEMIEQFATLYFSRTGFEPRASADCDISVMEALRQGSRNAREGVEQYYQELKSQTGCYTQADVPLS